VESIPRNPFLERNNSPSEWIPQEASILRERKEYTPFLQGIKLDVCCTVDENPIQLFKNLHFGTMGDSLPDLVLSPSFITLKNLVTQVPVNLSTNSYSTRGK
jgi:hypothetical protein